MIFRVIGDLVGAGGSAGGDDMGDRVCVGVDDGDRAVVEPDPKLVRPGYRQDSVTRGGQWNGGKEDAFFGVDDVDLRPDYGGRRGVTAIGKVVPCVRRIDPTDVVSRETSRDGDDAQHFVAGDWLTLLGGGEWEQNGQHECQPGNGKQLCRVHLANPLFLTLLV